MATTLLKYYRPPFPLYHPSHSLFYNKIFIRVPVYVRSFRFKFRLRCFSSILTNTSCSELGPLVDDFRHTKEPEKKRQLWLYNTMSKQKELFKPKVPGRVGMYVCGVTAYDLSHIGHARVYVSFDVLFRLSSLCCTSLLVVFGRIFQNVVIVELVLLSFEIWEICKYWFLWRNPLRDWFFLLLLVSFGWGGLLWQWNLSIG